MSTARKQTQRAEMVETHNLALSIKRLRSLSGWNGTEWRRSLYHAILMEGPDDFALRQKIREALSLP